MAALGLRSYMRAFSRCREQGLLFSAAHLNSFHGFLLLRGTGSRAYGLQQLLQVGSVVAAPGL